MIYIISSSKGEAGLLAALCAQRDWPCQYCPSVGSYEKLAERNGPRAVVVRQSLRNEYSDDILALLRQVKSTRLPRIVVLAPANFSAQQEARQIALGADCVLKDPLRMEVLFEYLAKYRVEDGGTMPMAKTLTYEFAGAEVVPHEHRLHHLGRSIHLAPQEIELLRLLSRSTG